MARKDRSNDEAREADPKNTETLTQERRFDGDDGQKMLLKWRPTHDAWWIFSLRDDDTYIAVRPATRAEVQLAFPEVGI